MSGALGALTWIVPLLTGNLWYFFPSLVVTLSIDYLKDKKYRVLVSV
jgi:hypothetical protein